MRSAKAGDEHAVEVLIERFLPAIAALARQYRAEGLELADLIQEGCLGLLRALARYDPERGTPFWPFARWWVRQSLQELRSDFLRPLRLPPKALAQLSHVKSARTHFYSRECREPSLVELATASELDEQQLEALLRADAAPRSLSDPVEGEDGDALGELLEDPLSGDDYEEVLNGIAGAQLRALLGRLTGREQEIVAARFNLDGQRSERLSDIGERLGISAERVRQLEERALTKLRQAAL